MWRYIASSAVMIAAACTTFMNWRFSFGLATHEVDRYIWAVFSVALDVCKWFMLPAAAMMWSAHRMRALAATAIWSIATLYSFVAALGFAAATRETAVAVRAEQLELHTQLEIMRRSTRWAASSACADATTSALRDFCKTYRSVAARVYSVPQDADPQSTLLARLTKLQPDTTRMMLSIFLATACELVSAFGLFALVAPDTQMPRQAKRMWSPPPANTSRHAVAGPDAPQRDTSRPSMRRPASSWRGSG